MFPRWFRAQVGQRMAIWAGMLGLLFLLYGTVEVIQTVRMSEYSTSIANSSNALKAHNGAYTSFTQLARGLTDPKGAGDTVMLSLGEVRRLTGSEEVKKISSEMSALTASVAQIPVADETRTPMLSQLIKMRADLERLLIEDVVSIQEQLAAMISQDRKNKILIVLLSMFVIGQILFLEYRWLVKPLSRMAVVLRGGRKFSQSLSNEALRRDEVGALARSLVNHFAMVKREEELSRVEKDKLSDRIARQENLKRESLSFQSRIDEIVHRLEDQAGQMSVASKDLLAISSNADERAAASADSTQRVSEHVDVVASSIDGIANTMTNVVAETERTSRVTAQARELVQAASEDARALTESARTIETVIALIQDVASQTNLLALNATIEAARAGEAGRGFAVVANEVKSLATKTAQATEEIRTGLNGITESSMRIAERVNKLVGSVEQVDSGAVAISASIREQHSSSQAITSNTARTAEDVRELAETFQHVAGLIADAKRAARLVTEVSAALGQQSRDLRESVNRYVASNEEVAA
jgi:methyl-accepting chemotaxis protein